jgi:gluconolactonase
MLRTEHYTEGVVVAADGTIFFSMTSQGTIASMHPGSAQSSVWAHVPAANGHAIDEDGSHLVMSSAGSIVRLDESGRAIDIVASKVGALWLTYPNDVTLDPRRGGYYVTDSGYKTMPQTVPPDPQGRVYRVDADKGVRKVAGGIAYANGIALSLDGSRLFVGESLSGRIWTYAVAGDGSLGARALFAETPKTPGAVSVPDGFAMGSGERLFVAHYGAREILVYDASGALVDRLPAGNKATSHAAFSPDGSTLYVSGGMEDESGPGAIFAIAL